MVLRLQSSIDLTRMECKDHNTLLFHAQNLRIDLTRMECKERTNRLHSYKHPYRFNQNGM